MKASRFYRSLFLLILLNGIIKPAWIFGIDRQVQNTVGASAYGQYFSLFSISLVLGFLSDLGFTVYYNRELSANDALKSQDPGRFLTLKLLLLLLYTIAVVTVALLTGIEQWSLLCYIILIQAFTSLFLFFSATITAGQWFSADALLSVTDKSLLILLCGAALYLPSYASNFNIQQFALLQASCLAFASLLAFAFLLVKGVDFRSGWLQLPPGNILKKAIPYGLIVLLMSAHARLDAFLLERMHPQGSMEAGIYAGAYRLLDAANMLGFLVASFLLPFLARNREDVQQVDRVLHLSRRLLISATIAIIIPTIFLAPWIQRLLYRHQELSAIQVLQLCIPSLLGYALIQVYGTALTASGQIKAFCMITAIGLSLNIVLNLLFIPVGGATGCCIAALISQSLTAIAVSTYAIRKLNLSLHGRSLLSHLLLSALLIGWFLAGRALPVSNWLLITGAILITFAAMLGPIRKEWKEWTGTGS